MMRSIRRLKLYHPIRVPLLLCMTACLLACLAFWRVYGCMRAAVFCGTAAYLISLRFFAPAILFLAFRRKYDAKARWFQSKPWEEPLYRRIGVKKWKKRILTYDPGEFSMREHSLAEIVENMCHAELVHELSAALGFTVLLCSIPFGAFPAFLAAAVFSAMIECPFIIVQRCNRPRLIRLMEKGKA